jgi:myosin-5
VAGAAQPLLEQAAELVAIEPADLSHALCTRRLVTRDDVVTVPLNREQSGDSRDALAKALYGKLFSWLVERCNEKLVDDSASTAFVGILDIFGFEQFQTNSFEQLCINYANERLQQQFNWDIFKAEQAEYEAEGIEWQAIEFVDNQECLDLIDKKSSMGLLHLLDEECKIQRGTDEKFAQKARQTHAEHKDFDAPKGDQLTFAVKHYAGCVAYLCSGFREKNKDTLHQDLAAVMQQSQAEVVLALFPSEAPERESKRAGKPKAKGSDTMTVGFGCLRG